MENFFASKQCSKCKENKLPQFYRTNCEHIYCEDCFENIFKNNLKEAICSKCSKKLKKQEIIYVDEWLEREQNIRKEVYDKIGRTREEFKDQDVYYDYLQDFEDIVNYRLKNKNLEEAEKLINFYSNQLKEFEKNERIIDINIDSSLFKDSNIFKELEKNKTIIKFVKKRVNSDFWSNKSRLKIIEKPKDKISMIKNSNKFEKYEIKKLDVNSFNKGFEEINFLKKIKK